MGNKMRSAITIRAVLPVLLVLLCAMLTGVRAEDTEDDKEEKVVRKVIAECTGSKDRLSCFSEKAAKALERAMALDVPLFSGMSLLKSREPSEATPKGRARAFQQPQQQPSAFGRFTAALASFLDTHTLTFDLTSHRPEEATPRDGGGGGGGGGHEGGGGGEIGFGELDRKDKKALKKEKKYMQYAFMVLLGIFGLTGPLVMKTLAIMAAKALIASKMALIIVGSVALKKIFEKDHEHGSVKVHTITEDEHDRVYSSKSTSPYWAYEPYLRPNT